MYSTRTRVTHKRGEGIIVSSRLPTRYEHGARYDVLIRGTIYRDIPHSEVTPVEETTMYAAGGWCGVAYHSPKLVKG